MKRKNLLFSLFMLLICTGLAFSQAAPSKQGKLNSADDAPSYEYMLRQNQQTGQIDPMDVRDARAAVQQASSRRTKGLGLTWSSIGPDNVGGRTRAIVIDNSDPSTLYTGSAGGGVWKSTTSGSSWIPMTVDGTTSKSAISVNCMAQASSGTIFAGTGEGWNDPEGGFGPGGFIGTGLYKSTDGNDFSQIAGTENWNFINEICINPSSGRIFLATSSGLFYSDDELTWTLAKDGNGDVLDGNAEDVCIGSNGITVAAVDQMAYISETGDPNTFVNHSTGAADKLPSSNVSRIEFDIAPSNPDYIYAMAASDIGTLRGVYRSTDKGQTWYIVGPGNSNDFSVFNFASAGGTTFIGRTNNTIKVLPNMPDVVIVGGSNLWQGTKITEDGYFAWTQLSSYQFGPLSPLYLHQGQNDIAFVPNSNNQLFVASDGGITKVTTNVGFQTKNKNYKTSQFYSIAYSPSGDVLAGAKDNGTLMITGDGNTPEEADQIYGGDGGPCAISMIDVNAMFVSQPNGFMRRTVDNGGSWRTVLDPDDMNNVDGTYLTPFILWESFFDYNSLDSVTFVADTNYNAGDEVIVRSHNNEYPFGYELPMAMNKGDEILVQDPVAARMFYGAIGEVWMTDEILDFNTDPQWMQIGEFQETSQSMAVTKDGDVLYVGTQEGVLYRFSNISSYVNDSTPNDIVFDTITEWSGRIITSLAFSPSNPNRLVVTLGNYGNSEYVYGTDNALSANPSFIALQGNLPALPVYTSLIELNHQDRVIVGTEFGIWSTDAWQANPTWAHETDGIPDVPVYQLNQQTLDNIELAMPIISGLDTTYEVFPGIVNYGVIYAATHGRGLFKCENFVSREDNPTDIAHFNASLDIYPNPSSGMVTLEYTPIAKGECHLQLFDIQGRIVYSKGQVVTSSKKQSLNLDLGFLQEGTYILRMIQNNTSIGINKLVIE